MMAWSGEAKQPEIRLMGFTEKDVVPVAFVHPELPAGKTTEDFKSTGLGGLAVHDGLLVVVGRELHRYTLGEFPKPLSTPEPLVRAGFEEPQRIAVGPDGRIYVSDWGASHQVTVFAADPQTLFRTGGAIGRNSHISMPQPSYMACPAPFRCDIR